MSPAEDTALALDRRNITDADIMRCVGVLDERRLERGGGDRKSKASNEANGPEGKTAEKTAEGLYPLLTLGPILCQLAELPIDAGLAHVAELGLGLGLLPWGAAGRRHTAGRRGTGTQRDRRNTTDADIMRAVGVIDNRKSRTDNLKHGQETPDTPCGASEEPAPALDLQNPESAKKTAELLGTSRAR